MVGANMRLSGYTIFLFAMPLSAALTYTTTERRHRTRLAPHEVSWGCEWAAEDHKS